MRQYNDAPSEHLSSDEGARNLWRLRAAGVFRSHDLANAGMYGTDAVMRSERLTKNQYPGWETKD